MIDVAGTGFTTLDRVYTNNVKTSEALGGSCGNVLISLAMLDRSVVPLLSLGDDQVGSSLIDEFTQAGVDTRYITRRLNFASPILAQELDLESGQHSFSFVCPETNQALPRYQPVLDEDVEVAKPVLGACAVFYTDRLTRSILLAMETAAASGALIFFEPSSIDDEELFDRAVRLCSVLKYSSERLSSRLSNRKLRDQAVAIVTHGAEGLEVSARGERRWCAAVPTTVVRDTCGAGDMLTVGIIDWILGSSRPKADVLAFDHFLSGVTAGQRLAAVNCAYAGARGVFRRHGARGARMILDGLIEDCFLQGDLFEPQRWQR
jgi:fructokinase